MNYLDDKACQEMRVDDATRAGMRFETNIELRYVGQEYSLPVPLPGTAADDEFRPASTAATRSATAMPIPKPPSRWWRSA